MRHRSANVWLTALLLGCGAARPPPAALPGPSPEGPDERRLARWLSLARAALSDLLVLPGEALPRFGPEARARARLRIERAREARGPTAAVRPALRREAAHAEVLLAQGAAFWAEGGRHRLASELDAAPARARRALARGARAAEVLDDLAASLASAAGEVRVTNARERAWALERARRHREATLAAAPEAALRTRLARAWRRYRDALTASATVAVEPLGPAIARDLGAPVDLEAVLARAEAAVAESRRELYQLALVVAPAGSADVDRRMEAALAQARAAGPRLELATLPRRLEAWLRAAGEVSVHVRRAARGLLVAGTTTVALPLSGLPGLDGPASPSDLRLPKVTLASPSGARLRAPAALGRLAPVVAEAVVLARTPRARAFPPDPVSTRALASALLTRLVRAEAGPSPSARLLAASFVVERRARALAEVRLHARSRETATKGLVEDAFHQPADARHVLEAAEIRPGRFASAWAAEMLLEGKTDCAGLPPGLCASSKHE